MSECNEREEEDKLRDLSYQHDDEHNHDEYDAKQHEDDEKYDERG